MACHSSRESVSNPGLSMAGFLASGFATGSASGRHTYWLRLLGRGADQWPVAAFVPGYSGGAAPDSHRYSLGGPHLADHHRHWRALYRIGSGHVKPILARNAEADATGREPTNPAPFAERRNLSGPRRRPAQCRRLPDNPLPDRELPPGRTCTPRSRRSRPGPPRRRR